MAASTPTAALEFVPSASHASPPGGRAVLVLRADEGRPYVVGRLSSTDLPLKDDKVRGGRGLVGKGGVVGGRERLALTRAPRPQEPNRASRRHAKLYPGPDGQWVVEDMGSVNGVLVCSGAAGAEEEDVRGPTRLANGDVVRFAGSNAFRFRFVCPAPSDLTEKRARPDGAARGDRKRQRFADPPAASLESRSSSGGEVIAQELQRLREREEARERAAREERNALLRQLREANAARDEALKAQTAKDERLLELTEARARTEAEAQQKQRELLKKQRELEEERQAAAERECEFEEAERAREEAVRASKEMERLKRLAEADRSEKLAEMEAERKRLEEERARDRQEAAAKKKEAAALAARASELEASHEKMREEMTSMKEREEKQKKEEEEAAAAARSGGGSAAELGAKLKEEYECGICCDVLTDPRVLECGHTFCHDCAVDWLGQRSTCPSCREPVRRMPVQVKHVSNTVERLCEAVADDEDFKEYLERVKKRKEAAKVADRKFAKLVAAIERTPKQHFLDVRSRWGADDTRKFRAGLAQQKTPKARLRYAATVGVDDGYFARSTLQELLLAASNLGVQANRDMVELQRRVWLVLAFGCKEFDAFRP